MAIVSEEAELPYQRPPLSKEYLAGAKEFERILIRPAGFWSQQSIQLLMRRCIVKVDPVTRKIFDGEGREITYGKLIWAAGAHARRLACVGIVPSVGPLQMAGAAGISGVDVDEFGRTTLPDIYAIGDCAAHLNPFAHGARIRLESVQNATDQANCAVMSILGAAEPYTSLPWFWSNQYGLRLQTIGLSSGYTETVVRGDPATRAFSLAYLREQRVIALDCVNTPRDYVQGRSLVLSRQEISRKDMADTNIPLRELIASDVH